MQWAQHLNDIRQGITRRDGLLLYEDIKKLVSIIDPEAKVTCTGGFRRGKLVSYDLDVLICSQNRPLALLHPVIDKLSDIGIVQYVMAASNAKTRRGEHDRIKTCGLLCKNPHSGKYCQVDIVECYPKDYAAALLSYTGSKHFEKSIRRYCEDRGLHLTSSGLYDQSKSNKMNVETEKDLFAVLNLDYLRPEHRNC